MSNSMASDTAAQQWLAPLLVGFGVYVLCAAYGQKLLNDGDTLTHIVIGRWVLDHGTLPIHDPFSYTAYGKTWVPHEWFAEVVLAILYSSFGWGGVVAATGLAAGTTFALLTGILQPQFGSRRATIAALLALLLVIGHLLARPHVFSWPLLILWMAGIIRARDRSRGPSFLLLPVMVLWCNLHGGFVVGLVLAGLLGVEAVLTAAPTERIQVMVRWGGFVVLATASALLSPNGWRLLYLPIEMLRMNFAVSSISEWHGVDFTDLQPIEVWIAVAVLAGFAVNWRLPLTRIALLLLLLHEALSHIRNQELLGFIGPLLVAQSLAQQFRDPPLFEANAPKRRSVLSVFRSICSIIAAIGVVGFGVGFTAKALNANGLQPSGAVEPVAAVQAARAAGLTGNVFNSLRFGGYLMMEGIPVFIDGRADLFGDTFLARYAAVTAGEVDGLPGLLDQYAVAWVLVEPHSPTATVIAHLPGWSRIYADPYAVIYRHSADEQQ